MRARICQSRDLAVSVGHFRIEKASETLAICLLPTRPLLGPDALRPAWETRWYE
jgi:hypothetical protein